MKSYKEIAENVLKRRDEYILPKKRRQAIILKTASSIMGTAAAVYIGITFYSSPLINDTKPSPDNTRFNVTEHIAETTKEPETAVTKIPAVSDAVLPEVTTVKVSDKTDIVSVKTTAAVTSEITVNYTYSATSLENTKHTKPVVTTNKTAPPSVTETAEKTTETFHTVPVQTDPPNTTDKVTVQPTSTTAYQTTEFDESLTQMTQATATTTPAGSTTEITETPDLTFSPTEIASNTTTAALTVTTSTEATFTATHTATDVHTTTVTTTEAYIPFAIEDKRRPQQ